ncbi:MAG: hypothetical protein AAFV72_01520 [Cyanobacteria bacterium J06635_1]
MASATLLEPTTVTPCQQIACPPMTVLSEGDWVSLLKRPSDYAHDQALLLCELSEERWLSWIPDHGEAALCLRQFCKIRRHALL